MMHRYRCGESLLQPPKLGVAHGVLVDFDVDSNLGGHINVITE